MQNSIGAKYIWIAYDHIGAKYIRIAYDHIGAKHIRIMYGHIGEAYNGIVQNRIGSGKQGIGRGDGGNLHSGSCAYRLCGRKGYHAGTDMQPGYSLS